MNAAGTYIQVDKEGYFPGSFRFFPLENSENYVNIKLLTETNIGQFDAQNGGSVESSEGIKLNFPRRSRNSGIQRAELRWNG